MTRSISREESVCVPLRLTPRRSPSGLQVRARRGGSTRARSEGSLSACHVSRLRVNGSPLQSPAEACRNAAGVDRLNDQGGFISGSGQRIELSSSIYTPPFQGMYIHKSLELSVAFSPPNSQKCPHESVQLTLLSRLPGMLSGASAPRVQ